MSLQRLDDTCAVERIVLRASEQFELNSLSARVAKRHFGKIVTDIGGWRFVGPVSSSLSNHAVDGDSGLADLCSKGGSGDAEELGGFDLVAARVL